MTVKSDGRTIHSELEALGEGAFEVSFMGEGETKHTLDITFNGEHIPGDYCNRSSFSLVSHDR